MSNRYIGTFGIGAAGAAIVDTILAYQNQTALFAVLGAFALFVVIPEVTRKC